MRVALIASSYLPHAGRLERHVDELARGLARRGTQVEVLTLGVPSRMPRIVERDGVVVRRFFPLIGTPRGAMAPRLWEHMRGPAASFDLAHVHSAHAPLALAAARAGFRRLVFTPHAPIQRLVRWPYGRVTRAVVNHAAQTVCTSRVEADLLCGRFPWAASRISFLPDGVNAAAIRAARPFAHPGTVVLAVGRLEPCRHVDRSIAAMASLDPSLRLVVVGDGPTRRRLEAHAADLQVSSRVEFVGSVPDAQLYRWLRTARVVVALAEQQASVLPVTEALTAGAAVVASDIPVHREAASYVHGSAVIFVSPEGSPLEVADAIADAARVRIPTPAPPAGPAWDAVADRTLALYETLVSEKPAAAVSHGDAIAEPGRSRPADVHELTVEGWR